MRAFTHQQPAQHSDTEIPRTSFDFTLQCGTQNLDARHPNYFDSPVTIAISAQGTNGAAADDRTFFAHLCSCFMHGLSKHKPAHVAATGTRVLPKMPLSSNEMEVSSFLGPAGSWAPTSHCVRAARERYSKSIGPCPQKLESPRWSFAAAATATAAAAAAAAAVSAAACCCCCWC
jgi:hypothetical protein